MKLLHVFLVFLFILLSFIEVKSRSKDFLIKTFTKKINEAIRKKDQNPRQYSTINLFYSCLEHSGNIPKLVLDTVKYQMNSNKYINLTHNYEYVLIPEYSKEQKVINKVFKICALSYPMHTMTTRCVHSPAQCKDKKQVNDCVVRIVEKINATVANDLDKSYNAMIPVQNVKAMTLTVENDEQFWIQQLNMIIKSIDPEYPGTLECVEKFGCGEYILDSY